MGVWEDAQGALVGAMGPGGILEVSGIDGGILDVLPVAVPVGTSLLAPAHGAAVAPIGGADPIPGPAVAHGALVPDPGIGLAEVVEDGPASGATGRAWGPDVVWTVVGGATAFGSRSKLKRDPNGKCCTTGNLERTSALYILIMPWPDIRINSITNGEDQTLFILAQPVWIPEIS